MNVLRWCPFVHLFDTPFQNSPYGHESTTVGDIPAGMLKSIIDINASMLTKIIDSSLRNGCFQDDLSSRI